MKKSLLDSQLKTLEEPMSGLIVSIAGSPEAIVDTIVGGITQITLKK
ncbi:MAG: hypothetical protein WBB19_03215 [Desulforhopalus sp.]